MRSRRCRCAWVQGGVLAKYRNNGQVCISPQRFLVHASVSAGARPLAGASRLAHTGYCYTPTVLGNVRPGTRAMTAESFGPVLPVIPFDTLDEVLTIANSVEFGLASFVWTSDLDITMKASNRLEYRMVGVNDWYPVTAEAPFGGVRQSGIGRESGTEGILGYLEPKTRYIRGL